MYRTFICAIVCLFVASAAAHAENPLGAIWPFSKKSSTPNFDKIDPFTSSKPTNRKSTLGLPNPSDLMDGAQQQTRKAIKGVQDFGKSLNPFAKRSSKPKASWLSKVLPKKQPVQGPPATMNDFMKLKRPRF
jgi:hypothetical protein